MESCRLEGYLVLATLALTATTSLARTVYEQSQTGDYNIHLDLKNVEVLAILDSSALGSSDYDYDYGEYTLKPPSNTSSASVGGPAGNLTGGLVPAAAHSGNASAVDAGQTVKLEAANSTAAATEAVQQPAGAAAVSTKPPRRCGAGFYRDQAGRCRRLRRPVRLGGLLQKAKTLVPGI